jgi:hypothetical protein
LPEVFCTTVSDISCEPEVGPDYRNAGESSHSISGIPGCNDYLFHVCRMGIRLAYRVGGPAHVCGSDTPPTGDRRMVAEDLDQSDIIVASAGQVSCDLDGETVILSVASGLYFGLDPVGTFIWSRLQESRTVAEIRDDVMREFEVERERCERDLTDLLRQLAEFGLIEVERPPLD